MFTLDHDPDCTDLDMTAAQPSAPDAPPMTAIGPAGEHFPQSSGTHTFGGRERTDVRRARELRDAAPIPEPDPLFIDGTCSLGLLLHGDPAKVNRAATAAEVQRALDGLMRDLTATREQLDAVREVSRVTAPVLAAAEALVKRWENVVLPERSTETLALAAAVKAARAGRIEPCRCGVAIEHPVGSCGLALDVQKLHLGLLREREAARAEAIKPRVVPCVAALVTDVNGRLLLVHTKRGWELPGGRMEPGETWRDALLRELHEETGAVVVLDAGEPRVFDGLPVNGAQYQSVIMIASGQACGAPPAPMAGDAVREARWFAAEEIEVESLSKIATAAVVREWMAEQPPPGCVECGALTAAPVLPRCDACEAKQSAPAWTPPPGVHPTVLHGSADGPLLIALVTLDPGAEVPREVHADREETIVVVRGHAMAIIGVDRLGFEDPMDLPAGCFCLMQAGEPHTIRNASPTEPASYLAILRRVEAAPVSDTTPAPAPAVELIETVLAKMTAPQQEALRLCADNHAAEWLDTENGLTELCIELRDMGLIDDDWDLTRDGRAALAALDAGVVVRGEGR